MELLDGGLAYRAAVGFLAGFGFSLVFRVARCFDISVPAVCVLVLYMLIVWRVPPIAAVVILALSLAALWRGLFDRIRGATTSTLVMSVGVQTIIFSLTTMIFRDDFISVNGARGQILGSAALGLLGALLLVAAVGQMALRTQKGTWWVRTVVDDPALAQSIGVPVARVQFAAYILGGLSIFLAAALWATQTEIRTSSSMSLVLYGIAIGGWGRSLDLLHMVVLAIGLAIASTLLSYWQGPLFADLSYLGAAFLATYRSSSLSLKGEN